MEPAAILTEPMDEPVKQSSGRTTILPIEWLVQVIQWQPTQFIFTIMSVNREWECACRYVIKHRQTVRVVHSDCPGKMGKPPDAFTIVIKNRDVEKVKQMLYSLKQMSKLTKIHEECPSPRHDNPREYLLDELMIKHAAVLREITGHHLVDNTEKKLMYLRLRRLTCNAFDAPPATRLCPRLEYLKITDWLIPGEAYQPLPSLATFRYTGMQGYPHVNQFIAMNAASLESIECHHIPAACLFPKLKELRVYCLPDDEHHVPALESLTLTSLPVYGRNFPLCKVSRLDIIVDLMRTGIMSLKEIPQIVNLTHIRIVFHDIAIRAGHSLPDPFSEVLNLVEVDISLRDGLPDDKQQTLPQAKTWASSLFQHNLQIRSMKLHTIPVSDEDLSLCSGLTQLSKFHLGYNMEQGYSIAGVQNLLRNVCHGIHEFSLIADEDTMVAIDAEFDAIEGLRGIKYTRTRKVTNDINLQPASYCIQ